MRQKQWILPGCQEAKEHIKEVSSNLSWQRVSAVRAELGKGHMHQTYPVMMRIRMIDSGFEVKQLVGLEG